MIYAIITVALTVFVYLIKQTGHATATNEQLEEEITDIEKANTIRVELDRDPAADERVRERFTR